jgi:hypothetical protein
MIHGIYLKSRPKGKWHLYSLAMSAEAASYDSNIALKEAKRQGNESAEVGIKTFDSSFYIPELLTEIKEQNPILN